MFGLLGRIFGSDKVIDSGMKLIDDFHYSDEEEAEDKRLARRESAKQKIEERNSYHPYKLAQRFIAFSFVGMYIFIMLNGVLGSLYGIIEMSNVKDAIHFADSMYLGEITLVIVGFYFGDVMVAKFTKRRKTNEKRWYSNTL